MKKEFTAEEKQEIIEKLKVSYEIIDEMDTQHSGFYNGYYHAFIPLRTRYHCYCKQGQTKPLPMKNGVCQYCGGTTSGYRWTRLHPQSKLKEIIKNLRATDSRKQRMYYWESKGYSETRKIDTFYVLEFDKEDPDLLYIYRCTGKIWIDEDGKDGIDINIMAITEVKAPKQIKSYTNNDKKRKMSAFDGLAMCSKTPNRKIVALGHKSFRELIESHSDFSRKSGLQEVMKVEYNSIITYLALVDKYPVLEQITKMGYTRLMDSIYGHVESAYNAESIFKRMNELSKLLNEEATQGSKSLKLPKYIGDFLNKHDALYDDFMAMTDIYQLDKTLSKENFEKLIEQDYFKILIEPPMHLIYLEYYANLLTYGYKLNELMRYVYRQSGVTSLKWPEFTKQYYAVIHHLQDYNRMCDLLQIKAEKFPKDARKAHDAIVSVFNQQKQEIADTQISSVAKKYEKIAVDVNSSNQGEYLISLPRSSRDLINEGVNQHNCVGSYIRKIAERRSVVFFIRKKDDPQSSFVTAEYADDKLSQLYYSNNRTVEDKQIKSLAQLFVKKAVRQDQVVQNPS